MKIVLLTLLSFVLLSCSDQQQESLVLSGSTMGTRYHITIRSNENHVRRIQLQQDIDRQLADINQQMSTYIDNSEISRFNHYTKADWFLVSNELFHVVDTAIKAHNISSGAFDPTVYPLVDLWGFAKQIKVTPPSQANIDKALHNIGLRHLSRQNSPAALAKSNKALSIDLSAIAKGYAVDALSHLLKEQGFTNYLVEIGGEIHAQGRNKKHQAWRIAIEQPTDNILEAQPKAIKTLNISNQSVATSGNYRNYYEYDGKRYSHTLDPKTGRPTKNKLASVTVIHPSAMWADAMATAIMVMGEAQGIRFANRQKLGIFMVIHDGQKQYRTRSNSYFTNHQKE